MHFGSGEHGRASKGSLEPRDLAHNTVALNGILPFIIAVAATHSATDPDRRAGLEFGPRITG